MEEIAISTQASSSSLLRLSYNELLTIYGRAANTEEKRILFELKDIFNSMVEIISSLDFTIRMRIVEGYYTDIKPQHWIPPDFLVGYKTLCGRSLTPEEEESVSRLDNFWELYQSKSKLLEYPMKLKVTFPPEQPNKKNRRRRKQTFDFRNIEEF